MNDAEIDLIAEQAAAMPKQQRQQYVTDLCRGDAHAIQQVLQVIEFQPSGFLDELPGELAGCRCGEYTLVTQIGQGGCGEVYAARRTGETEVQFAVKVLREHLRGTPVFHTRFAKEQQVLLQMQHPNIAAHIDSGQENGRPYFVMELVPNACPITQYCEHFELDLAQRLRLFESVCDAVAHAHHQGIIHRDIKPSNILVSRDEVTGVAVPKLIDFGIAKALDQDSQSAKHTRHGEFVGTRAYASPEQLRGLGTDTRTDIYGMGLVLYELLTGTPALALDDFPDTSELMSFICEHTFDAPSSVNRASGRPIASGALDSIVLTALHKKPERRYQTIEEFVGDVIRFRQGKRVNAHPDSFWYNTMTFFREHSLFSAALCLSLLLLVIALWYGQRAATAERVAKGLLQDLRSETREKSEALQRATVAEAQQAANLSRAEKVID
ncbi:MAG: serine/threonine protein kinase, partial [Planctomycetales bacterium]|nr:serine/threonine protein kinase [Planctomycetales bacterium]